MNDKVFALDRIAAYAGRSRNECWPWSGHVTALGYGTLPKGKRNQYAHRVMYQIHIGPIPDGLVLDHLCRNRACVNPWHLEPVTIVDNVLRGLDAFVPRAVCKNGHEAKANRPSGRVCVECDRAAGARYRARLRARQAAGGK